MARTRAQAKATAGLSKSNDSQHSNKRGADTAPAPSHKDKPAAKKAKATFKDSKKSALKDGNGNLQANVSSSSAKSSTITRLLDQYGAIPLSSTSLADPQSPTAETLLALLLNALLSSARISHTLAARATAEIIETGYHDLAMLKQSTFDERCKVLTEGGYARYREKTARELEKLGEWLEVDYDGDLNNLIAKAGGKMSKVRELLKEVKGLGDVGVDIFFDTAQGVVPSLAPFVDPRSMKTAETIGLGQDIGKLYEMVGKEPMKMCKLASALTNVRLQKTEGEFAK